MPTTKPNTHAKVPAKTAATRAVKTASASAKIKVAPFTAPIAVVEPAPLVLATPSKVAPSKGKSTKAAEHRATLARRASVMLKFVSDPTRLQVILFLAESEHHVGALCTQLDQSQPAVSHHLALLRHGGIIFPRRNGKNNFYSLSETGSELAKVVKSLLQIA